MTHGQGKLGRLGEHPGVALEPMGEPQGRVRPERTGSLRGLQGWPDATTLIDLERPLRTLLEQLPHLTDVENEARSAERLALAIGEPKLGEHPKWPLSRTSSLSGPLPLTLRMRKLKLREVKRSAMIPELQSAGVSTGPTVRWERQLRETGKGLASHFPRGGRRLNNSRGRCSYRPASMCPAGDRDGGAGWGGRCPETADNQPLGPACRGRPPRLGCLVPQHRPRPLFGKLGTGSEGLFPFSGIMPFELFFFKKAAASEPCLTTPKEFFPGIGRKLTHI